VRWTCSKHEGGKNVHMLLVGGIIKGEEGLEDLEADAVIALDLKSTGYEVVVEIYVAKKQGQVEGCCECGDEPSCSIKCKEFLD